MRRIRRIAVWWLVLSVAPIAAAAEVVIDFEGATLFLENARSNRVEKVVEQGVVFQLAHEPRQSKGKGLLTYFAHIPSGRKGLLSAMAQEAIPVRATFPQPVSAVTVSMWGSTATPAVLEAFDAEGKVVDRASADAPPNRKSPADPAPVFQLSVKAARIAYVQWSGPRPGEYLVVDELRFTPAPEN
jgi:hypothetical protein